MALSWLIFLCTVLSLHLVAVASSGTYWYVNTVNLNSDDQVLFACLSPGGCQSINYLPAGCNGCFDPSCNKTALADLAQGDTLTFTSILNGAVGAMVCSTGQLAIKSGGGTIFHEWIPGSLSGNKFAYATFRGVGTSCGIFSHYSGTLDVVASTGTSQVALTAFTVTTVSSLDAQNFAVKFSSNQDFVISCARGADDYSNLAPLSTQPLYHWDSENSRLMAIDCATMASTAEVPTCQRSDEGSVSLTVDGTGQIYTLTGDTQRLYSGEAHRCSASNETCFAIFTTADSNGLDTTTAFYEERFGQYFVLLRTSVRLAALSTTATLCTVDISGSLSIVNLTGSTNTGIFRGYKDDITFPAGTIITCDNPSMIILDDSASLKEYNLYGVETSSLWSDFLLFETLAPTSSPSMEPTSSPSLAPTMLPTTSPSLAPSLAPSTSEPTSSPSIGASGTAAPTSVNGTAGGNDNILTSEAIAGIAAGAVLGGGALILGGLFASAALGGAVGGAAGGAAAAGAGGAQGGPPPIGGFESFASGDGSQIFQELTGQGIIEGALEQIDPDDAMREPKLREGALRESDGENSEFEIDMDELL